MEPRRIVQLALGVPDAIDAQRRDYPALILLVKKAELALDYMSEIRPIVENVYKALIEALEGGGLDGVLADLEPVAAGEKAVRQHVTIYGDSYDRRMIEDAIGAGVSAIVEWAQANQRVDD
jgi:hypothetical protein